jgi:hypothetical protein
MDDLLQQQRTIREAGRAKRRAARPARLPRPVPAPADDSSPALPRPAAWYSGNSVSAAGQSTDDQTHVQVKRTDQRMRLRDGIQRFSGLDSVRGCETAPIGEAMGVRARAGEKTGFAGLMRCGSVWSCPVCGPRVRGERAATLERYAQAWLEHGHGLYLLTLTVPHWEHVRLADYTDEQGRAVPGQLSKLLEGWRGIGQGAWWVGRKVVRGGAPVPWSRRGAYLDDAAFPPAALIEERVTDDGDSIVWRKGFAARYGVVGTTRTAEVTDGANGWHSHLHALVWTEKPADRATAEQLQAELSRRWANRARAVGLPTPDPKVGCRVDPAGLEADQRAALARYIAKVQERDQDGGEVSRAVASELVRGDYKLARGAKGLTPFDLAELAVAGSDKAKRRWLEYERATKGRRCLTWSHGLQERLAALLGEDVDERTDEQLADELAEAEARQPNLAIARRPFRQAVAHRHGGRADVAMAGYVGGLAAVEQLLVSWGLQQGEDFWRLDPLGPGLPTTGEQIARARGVREAKAARITAADAVPTSRTPQEWARVQEANRHALERVQEQPEQLAVDVEEDYDRAAAHAEFRARLRAAKASVN